MNGEPVEKGIKGIILIIDDNPTNLGILFTFLSESGFKVLVAVDGMSALEQLEYTQPDIILLDIMMPGLDGFETCAQLKKNPKTQEIPVIFLTALSDVVDKVKGFELGAVDYITKPIQNEEVLSRVQTHLTLRNLQKQLQAQNLQLQQEILQRQRAEEIVRASEAKYRTLIEQIPAVTYIAALDDFATKLYVSPRVEKLLGFSAQDWEQKPDLWMKQIHPDDCQRVLSDLYVCQRSGKPFSCEYRLLSKEGRVIWVYDAAALVRDDQGKLLSFQGVMLNITALKQAEIALRASEAKNRGLLNAIPDLMYCINAEGVFLEYIPAKDDSSQLSPAQFLGKTVMETFSEELAYWTMHHVEEALGTGKVQSGEYVQMVDNVWRSYDARFFALGDGSVLVLVRDVTDRKRLSSALIESQAQLAYQTQKLEAALAELQATQSQLIHNAKMVSLGQLVAGIAHEINNPVSFIQGNISHAGQYATELLHLLQLYQENYPHPAPAIQTELESLDLEFLSQDFPQLLQSMQHGVNRIQKIVKSLRTFSHLDEAAQKKVNLHEGLESVLLMLQPQIAGDSQLPEIEVVKVYGDLPLVECFPGELNQAFLNILSNAIDALRGLGYQELGGKLVESKFSSRALRIWIETMAETADVVQVKIKDNGCGIPEEVLGRIVDPFFTTKPVGAGTGLGLFISHQIIVKKHQGQLNYLSTPGAGTEIVIKLPVKLGG